MAQSYTFNGPSKRVYLTSTSSFLVQDMYSRWKEWMTSGDNAKYLQAFRSVGGDPTTPGRALGRTYFLVNGWQIVPFSADHRLQVEGNLYHDDLISPFLPATASFSVIIESTVSNITELATTIIYPTASLNDTKMDELWKVHGLDPSSSLYVSKTERVVGDIVQLINNVGSGSAAETTIIRV